MERRIGSMTKGTDEVDSGWGPCVPEVPNRPPRVWPVLTFEPAYGIQVAPPKGARFAPRLDIVALFTGGPFDGQCSTLPARFTQVVLPHPQPLGPDVRYALLQDSEPPEYVYRGEEPPAPPAPPLPAEPF